MKDERAVEHGPETVCYSNGPFGFRPYLQCLCGWDVIDESWEFIGVQFDEHLEQAENPTP